MVIELSIESVARRRRMKKANLLQGQYTLEKKLRSIL